MASSGVKSFWMNVLAVVVAGALSGNVVLLFQICDRLTRLEAKLENVVAGQTFANAEKR